MYSYDEASLVELAKEQPQAFGKLYEENADRIFAYVMRQVGDEALAHDITAVTFEKALRHLRRYEPQGKSFCAWLYRIARNECMSHWRRQRFLAPLNIITNWFQSDVNVESSVAKQEEQDVLHIALNRLKARDRELLMLRFFENLSSQEIGEIMGYTENNVNVRLYRALGRLREEFACLTSNPGVEYVS